MSKKIKQVLQSSLVVLLTILGISAVLAIGYFGISYFNNSYFDQYKETSLSHTVNSEWRFVNQLLWMAGCGIAFILLVAILSLLQTLTGRWRPVKVFISYEHKHADIVSILEKGLKSRWVKPVFVPFSSIDHDELLDTIRTKLRSANAVLVLPGLERSFVDSEILAALVLDKPIVFLKIIEEQRTPDTSFKGYPILDLGKLRELDLLPLQRFLLYVTRSSKDLIKNFRRTLMEFYEKKAFWVVVGFFACDTVAALLMPITSFFVNLEWEEKVRHIIYWIFTATGVGIFCMVYIKVIIDKLRAMKIARQKIITGKHTYELLEKGLDNLESDGEILWCMLREPLPTRY